MKSTPQRTLDAITARAIHDPAMRAILNDLEIFEAEPAGLRAALDNLDEDKRRDLLARSERLEATSGRSNQVYAEMGDFAQAKWIALMAKTNERAKVALKDMEPALQAIRSGDTERYERFQQKFAEEGKAMTDAVAKARNELRREIRRELPAMNIDLDTEARAPLVDHLTRAASVPAAVSEVMIASSKLEAARAQHALTLEQRRHLGPAAAPKPSFGF